MTDPTPAPEPTQGTPPPPRRRLEVRHPVPLSPLRTVAVNVSGMAAALGALSIVGLHGLPVEALTPVCMCIAACAGGQALKSSVEHVARGMRGPQVEP